ncbi:MAG TPA: hypothetical protein PLL77_03375 [Pyrinomonadaceae bacterium]|nr:hypothetical protein [Pyrinomonadaceae bacterium]
MGRIVAGVGREGGEVVDDDDLGAGCADRLVDRGVEEFVEAAVELVGNEVKIAIGRADELWRKTVADRQLAGDRRRARVAFGKLRVRLVEIEEQDRLSRESRSGGVGELRNDRVAATRDRFGDLDGEEAFADAGFADQQGKLARSPEARDEIRRRLGPHHGVRGMDVEHAFVREMPVVGVTVFGCGVCGFCVALIGVAAVPAGGGVVAVEVEVFVVRIVKVVVEIFAHRKRVFYYM